MRDDSGVESPQVEKDIVDIATQKSHDTDADGEHGAEAEAVAVLVVEHGESHLAVASPVTLTAVARVTGRRVGNAGAMAARPAGTQCVHTHFALGGLFGHVAWRTPMQGGDSHIKHRTNDTWEAVR